MKECKNCSKEFEPKHQTRGSEQKYCSIKCRQASAQIRMINRIKENVKQDNEKENEVVMKIIHNRMFMSWTY